jgi:hypothetical protein
MHGVSRRLRAVLLWGACLTAAACAESPVARTRGVAPDVPETPRPRRAWNTEQAPDLRIAPDATASAQEIPLVPIPPPPLYGTNTPRSQGSALPPPPPLAGPNTQRPQDPTAPGAPQQPTIIPITAVQPSSQVPPVPTTQPPQVLQQPQQQPAAPPAITLPEDPFQAARFLQQRAAERYAGMDSYLVRLTRREQVNGQNKPEEVMLFKFRKEPWSVYFKWLGPNGAGRECVYVKGRYENKIHTLLAAGDVPLMPAGKRLSLAPDSALVRSNSRHSITEAGLGSIIERLGFTLRALERGDRTQGTVVSVQMQKRPDYATPLAVVELVVPPGAEAEMPRGGRRLLGFDTEIGLPMLVETRDDRGQEVEYYRHDRLQFPVRLDDADFDPARLWKK